MKFCLRFILIYGVTGNLTDFYKQMRAKNLLTVVRNPKDDRGYIIGLRGKKASERARLGQEVQISNRTLRDILNRVLDVMGTRGRKPSHKKKPCKSKT